MQHGCYAVPEVEKKIQVPHRVVAAGDKFFLPRCFRFGMDLA
jgi:hypothetical protein